MMSFAIAETENFIEFEQRCFFEWIKIMSGINSMSSAATRSSSEFKRPEIVKQQIQHPNIDNQHHSSIPTLPTAGSAVSRQLDAYQKNQLAKAKTKYENLVNLTPAQEITHADNQVKVNNAVEGFLSEYRSKNLTASPEEVRTAVAATIATILDKADIDRSAYSPKNADHINGYSKFLLYSNENAGVPFCFQLFRFGSHQKTPIHDHPVNCASYVLEGDGINERHYEKNKKGDLVLNAKGRPLKSLKDVRAQGTWRDIDLEANNPHSIKNDSNEPALTVHIYFMDGGVNRTAAVEKMYDSKEKQPLKISERNHREKNVIS
jgi:predicted metal-dependent enzyme (double-stranded beta helix superfamily)